MSEVGHARSAAVRAVFAAVCKGARKGSVSKPSGERGAESFCAARSARLEINSRLKAVASALSA